MDRSVGSFSKALGTIMRRKLTGHTRIAGDEVVGYPNPLLRDCDLRQAQIKRWVVTLLIVMVPFSLWIGTGAYSEQQQRLDEQRTSIHQVTATTTDVATVAPTAATSFDSTNGAAVTAVPSQWVYRGVEHTGRVSVDTGSPVGTTAQIWVNDAGELSLRPLTSSDVVAAAIFSAVGSWILAATALIGFYYVMRFRYDGRRNAEWDREIADLLSRH
ncbi:hypothetical protein HQO16_18655 [Rhodococcus fascians]|nr:hypothetical protein [Rhodococcus fascians]